MTYTVGLIGLSWVGAWHYDAYDAVDGIDVVAIADVDQKALSERGEEWKIPDDHRYTEQTALLAEEDLDAVSIATPSFLHHQHVIDAAESRADPDVIWVEKPIATSVSEADEMVNTCKENKIELIVNHSRRFGYSYQKLKTLLDKENLLGDILSINVTAPEELLRNGTHSIDLLNYLLDEHFEWCTGYLTGHSERMDEAFDDSGGSGMLRTVEETYAHIDCTVPRGIHDGTWNIVGTDGKLYIDSSRDICRYWSLVDRDDAPYGRAHEKTELPQAITGFDDQRDMFRNGAGHVVELLDGTATNVSPGEDAAHVLETIVALFVSHYTNSRIELPLERPLRDAQIRSR